MPHISLKQFTIDSAIAQDVLNEISNILNKNKNLFDDFDSTEKIINLYKNVGLYVEPESCRIGSVDKSVIEGSKLHLNTNSILRTCECK